MAVTVRAYNKCNSNVNSGTKIISLLLLGVKLMQLSLVGAW